MSKDVQTVSIFSRKLMTLDYIEGQFSVAITAKDTVKILIDRFTTKSQSVFTIVDGTITIPLTSLDSLKDLHGSISLNNMNIVISQ